MRNVPLPVPEAKPHCAYLFANRMKVQVYDGVGIWLAARRLNQGKFHWPGIHRGTEVELDPSNFTRWYLDYPGNESVRAAQLHCFRCCLLAEAVGLLW